MKIGFYFDYDQTWTFTAVFAAMNAQQKTQGKPLFQACGILINNRYYEDARKNLPPETGLLRLYDVFQPKYAPTPQRKEMEAFQAFDERIKGARFAYADRHLLRYNYTENLNAYVALYQAYADFLDREKPDAFVFNAVVSGPSTMLYEMLKERNIRILIPSFFGLDTYSYIFNNPQQIIPEAYEIYAQFKAGKDRPHERERDLAEKFYAKLSNKQPAYKDAAPALMQERAKLPNVARGLTYLKNYWQFYRFDPTELSPIERLKRVALFRWRLRQVKQYFKPLSALSGKFIFYPLHFEPEYATLTITQCDQMSAIDLIARRIPFHWKLVLKEHPTMLGQRDPAFYKHIRTKYPNVIILDATIPASKLLSRAEAVFTLSGTVSLEAMVQGVPILMQSKSRFGSFKIAEIVEDFFAFESSLANAINHPPQKEDVLLMLAAIARNLHDFLFVEPHGNAAMLDEKNIANIATAFIKHIEAA